MPRRRMAAAKPARSPTTPPPRARTRSRALDAGGEQLVAQLGQAGIALARLAGRHDDRRRRIMPAAASAASSAQGGGRRHWRRVTMTQKRPRSSGRTRAPARSMARPRYGSCRPLAERHLDGGCRLAGGLLVVSSQAAGSSGHRLAHPLVGLSACPAARDERRSISAGEHP